MYQLERVTSRATVEWRANEPGRTERTRTPPKPSCSEDASGAKLTPRTGLVTRPYLMICSTMPLSKSTGRAKPTPDEDPDAEYMAVLMPMKFPLVSKTGPPELPCDRFTQCHKPMNQGRMLRTEQTHRIDCGVSLYNSLDGSP